MSATVKALFLLALFVPGSAAGLDCRSWKKSTPDQKREIILAEVDRRLAEPRTQKYRVNRARMRVCLEQRAPAIQTDFDDACAQGKRVSMRELDNLLTEYIVSCATP